MIMTQTNWYQSIMNDFGLQDCISVTKIGVINKDLVVLSHSNSNRKCIYQRCLSDRG